MKIAIYGAGSLGTVLGAFLAKGGMEADLVTRNAAHVAALRSAGARVIGTADLTVPVRAFLPEEMADGYDLIFLLTKQLDNDGTVRFLASRLAEDGVVCTMQNGLPEPAIARIVGEERTCGCAVAWGATLVGPGVCELTSEAESLTFSLGSLTDRSADKLPEIKRVLETMGPVAIEANFIGARWVKLLVNCAFSGMSAVLGCTYGEVAADVAARRCAQRIIKECIDVAAAAGIEIEPIQGKDVVKLLDYTGPIKRWISFAIIPLAIRKHRLLKASMLQDLEKGRKCEIDSINGIVCEYGDRLGLPTPFNDRVREIVHGIEAGTYAPRRENVGLFRTLA